MRRAATTVAALLLVSCGPSPSAEERRASEIAAQGAWRAGWKPPAVQPSESELVRGARMFAHEALGAEATALIEVEGVRERAVCARAGARRFIYRAERRPIVEGEFPPAAFQQAVEGWCPAGWPRP